MPHRLLVVNDEPHLLRKLESSLSPEGFDVVTARTGRDALIKIAQAIASSVSRGLTNKEIAAEMAISVRTVENHISHILDKKHFNNRVEIARYVMEHGA